MDIGRIIAKNLLSFKKGFEGLDDVGGIEWETLQTGTISFSDLIFDIHCIKRELEIKISSLEDSNWNKLRKYFEFAGENSKVFYEEHGFSQGFLKQQYDFLENRTHLIKESRKQCIINAKLFTNNRNKLKDSIFYSIVVPFTKYKSFSDRRFT